MTDPFIPTGRELDEGITGEGLSRPQKKQPRRLRELFGRISRHTGKQFTQLELDLPDSVAMQRPRVRPRTTASPQDASPQQEPATRSELQSHVQAPTRSTIHQHNSSSDVNMERTSHQPQPRFGDISVKEESSGIPLDFIASIIGLTREPGGDANQFIRESLSTQRVGASESESALIEWWMDAEQPTLPALPERLEQHLSEELLLVITEIQTQPSSHGALTDYQDRCDAWDDFDEAVKAVRRATRSYSSLTPFLESLESLDFEAANRQMDYTTAAWHENTDEISRAIRASQALSSVGGRPVMARLPRAASDLPLLDRAVIASLCTPSSLAALRRSCREVIEETKTILRDRELLAFIDQLLPSRTNS